MRDLKDMTLRELINSTAQDEEHIGVDGLSPWKVIDELERRLPEIEAAFELAEATFNKREFTIDIATRETQKQQYNLWKAQQNALDAYRAARDARSGK